ncbi:amino acid adenylation domain-containing protein [Streptomyces sp. NPDC048665]|uniref:amino acid adenylation domain-containing protein n=1 Tax=Streptomyces sp. NPDC048665 TaxID=3155490 RepID=UPI00341B8E93
MSDTHLGTDVPSSDPAADPVHAWNDTTRPLPSATLPELFTAQAARTPEATALVYGETKLTYAQLDARSDQIARHLTAQGVGPEALVAVMMERGIDLVVALLAVWKAGAAYLPIDPVIPAERIAYMLDDAKPVMVLAASHTVGLVPGGAAVTLIDDPHLAVSPSEPVAGPGGRRALAPANTAYVIYTSGSTGRPKGVVVSHGGAVNLVAVQAEHFAVDTSSRVLQFASAGFDAAVWELLMALCAGACLVLAPAENLLGAQLPRLVARHGITHANLPPAVLSLMAPEDLGTVSTLVSAGEALASDLAARWATGRCLINGYGPTETTVCATLSDPLTPGEGVNIGGPISNTRVFVLDDGLRPLPVGVAGELYVAGAGLARGYLGRAGLTAERFIACPYPQAPGERMYRTGDLARWSPNGTLEFLGRVDDQVKIRGFRIELGEIEAVLAAHPQVAQAVVIAREDTPGDKRLTAYITTTDAGLDIAVLRQWCRRSLPDFMTPGWFVFLNEIPLTVNGKIDRKALPKPRHDRSDLGQDYTPPRTEIEQLLVDVWADILGLERIGIHDNFFDLGGHSLLATILITRLRSLFGLEITIREVFSSPTIATLAAQLDISAGHRGPALLGRDRSANAALSFAQQRLWFLDQLAPQSSEYVIPCTFRIRGALDVEALKSAFRGVVERHEVMRTRFVVMDGHPVQAIDAEPGVKVNLVDASGESDAARRDQIALAAVEQDARLGFDLSIDHPLRVTVVRLADDEHLMLVAMHHAAADGWSMEILTRELRAFYEAAVTGRPAALDDLTVQYADYAAWQRNWLTGDVLERQLEFWRKQLEGLQPLELPTDLPRPLERSGVGGSVRFSVPVPVTRRLADIATGRGSSQFMAALAAFQVVLSRWSGQDDVAVGSPIAGRTRAELEDLIGFFVNTLVMRTDTSRNPTFVELLDRVRETALGAYAHQDLPFERLVEELTPERDLSRNPLFQISFVFQNFKEAQWTLPGMSVEALKTDTVTSKFDLLLTLVEGSDGGLDGEITYSMELFEEATVRRMAGHYLQVLEQVTIDPGQRIGQIELLTPAECGQLTEWARAGGASDSVPEVTLADAFEVQAARSPRRPALTCDETTIEYAELNARANRLARLLMERGSGPGQFVALALPRSTNLVVALLAIMKSGAAYIPIDPEVPADRITYILEDARPEFVITTAAVAERIPDNSATCVVLADPATEEKLAALPDHDLGASERTLPSRATDAAYVIYTSGSTGQPKGVVVTHLNVMSLFTATRHLFGFHEDDVWTLFHSYAFDFSVWELWGPLLHGGRLVIVPYEVSRSPKDFLTLLVRERVTVVNQTPSAFSQLMRADRESPELSCELALRYVVFGGEALDLTQLGTWYERHAEDAPVLVNMYGITETTVHVSHRALTERLVKEKSGSIIGIGLPSLEVHILDGALRPTPVGVAGEIYVAGGQLARGYLNRPQLTAGRFVANPFGPPGSRLYRSGDLARWTRNGQLEYLGRADNQIKLRGFRIEPGEIEAALIAQAAVAEARVLVRADVAGDSVLTAYVVPAPGATPRLAEIRDELRNLLPAYMVPTAYVLIDTIPLTSNGKLNRDVLPAPTPTAAPSRGRGGAVVRPANELEGRIVRAWSQILGAAEVSVEDNFFDIGGDSFKAVALARAVGHGLSVVAVFQNPTPRALAKHLAANPHDGAPHRWLHQLTRGRPADDHPRHTLVCIPYGGGSATAYQPLAGHLPRDFDLWSVALPGHDPTLPDQPVMDWGECQERLVEEIAASVQGPFSLYGHCAGTFLTVQVARGLEDCGLPPTRVHLGAAFPPYSTPPGTLESALSSTDEQLHRRLASLGGFGGALDEVDLRHVLRAVRHDMTESIRFVIATAEGWNRLRTPIHVIIGDQDTETEGYETGYRGWEHYSQKVSLQVIEGAGHYFVQDRAALLSKLICG